MERITSGSFPNTPELPARVSRRCAFRHIFKFQIYKNLFQDCNYSENYNDWGPCQILKRKYGHPTSPNHLGVQGQDIVLEKFTKDLESWKYD